MLRFFEISALAVFSACHVAVGASVPTGNFLQFGALGLVAFMILQNYRQQNALGKVIAEKDRAIAEQNGRMANLIAADTDAKNRLADVLKDRTCLVGDVRLALQKGT